MYAFILKKKITIITNDFIRTYLPQEKGFKNIELCKTYIHCGNEKELILEYLQKTNESLDNLVFINETQLLSWKYTPPRIGRLSAKIYNNNLELYESKNPLIDQLNILKQKFTDKSLFTIAIINPYGANLGDSTMGATAMRYISKIIKEHLGDFKADMFLGLKQDLVYAQIISDGDWVGNVYHKSPLVEDLAMYDAYFDFTGLMNLPRINELPMVDWFLWWCGIEPEDVESECKRNKLVIAQNIYKSISDYLEPYTKVKKLFFNPKASVALRSCPDAIAKKILKELLNLEPSLYIIIDQDIEYKHKRVINLHKEIDSPQKFIALVAQVDGVITVDTFTHHIAAAFSIPAVTVTTSLDPQSYRYYPFAYNTTIPNAKKLPAWNKFKVNKDEWQKIKPQYDKAWMKLDISMLLNALNEKIEYKISTVKNWIDMPYLPVSWGEVFDKLTILDIKLVKIDDKKKRDNIYNEKKEIQSVVGEIERFPKELPQLIQKLYDINLYIWDIEENKRKYEKTQDFDDRFISLARDVYIYNDQRSVIKKDINLLLNSYLVEEKSHQL